MKNHYDFTKGRKNPYAKKLKKEGYSIMINYNPQGAEDDAAIDDRPASGESTAFEEYRAK